MSDSLSEQRMAIDLWIEEPISLSLSPQGELTVTCFQQIAGSTNPLKMHLRFTPEAGGQLLALTKHLQDEGLVHLTTSNRAIQ